MKYPLNKTPIMFVILSFIIFLIAAWIIKDKKISNILYLISWIINCILLIQVVIKGDSVFINYKNKK